MASSYNTVITLESGKTKRTGTIISDSGNATPFDYTYDPSTAIPEKKTITYEPTVSIKSTSKLKDEDSFKKIVRSGTIKMTPLSNSEIITHNKVVLLDQVNAVISFPHIAEGSYPNLGFQTHVAKWLECFDWDRRPAVPEVIPALQVPDLESSINAAKSSVISSAQSSFDALTTAAEGKEAIELIVDALRAVRHPLTSFANAAKALKSPKEISSLWLQYRYGIMPLVMTVKDALALIDQREAIFLTERSNENGNSNESSYDGPYTHIYAEDRHDFLVRGISKARYATSQLQLADQINVNPFLTGWELITFSFVIDWFLNVGDFIQAKTMSILDVAEQRVNAYSVTTRSTRRLYYNRVKPDYIIGRKTGPYEHTYKYVYQGGPFLLREIEKRTYDRYLFSPDEVKLQLNPSMNWKRWADSLALAISTQQSALRLLRKLL